MSIYCKNCGEVLNDDAGICTACGEKIYPLVMQTEKPPVASPVMASVLPTEKPKKKKKILGKLIGAFLILAVLGVVAWFLIPVLQNAHITEFAADEIYFVCEEESVITFTAKIESNSALSFIPVNVKLVKGENEVIGKMHDDGKNGDAAADDHIHTLQIGVEMESEEIVSERYQCKTGKVVGDEVTIYYFPLPTAKSVQKAQEDFNTVQLEIWEIEAGYAGEDGYVPEEDWDDLLKEIQDRVDDWVEDGIILHYENEENGIYLKFVSGRGGVYTPAVPDTDANGSDVAMQVITCQPQFDEMRGASFVAQGIILPDDVKYALEMLDVSGNRLATNFEEYTFSESDNYDNSAVTLDVIDSFGPNQVVLWHGHGYYSEVVKSALVTGQLFDWDAYRDDPIYYANYVTNRCVNGFTRVGDPVIITSKYIGYHCSDLDNSFFYLAACSSGKSPELANAFLGKGAAAVVANSETIYRGYNVVMLYETVRTMMLINKDTNNYYTLSEALEKAKETYGEDDGDPRYQLNKSVSATPLIFGGSDANDYRFKEATGNLSGKICKANDILVSVPNAKVDIYLDNELYESTVADENGMYSVELRVGEYYIEIGAEGYLGFRCYATVYADVVTYMETFLLILESDAESGIAGGKIHHAFTGNGVEGVELSFVKDWNNPNSKDAIESTVTDADGNYTVELPIGNYTVVASKADYVSISFNIVVQEGETLNQNGTITPSVAGSDYLITLTWDAHPEDLDCHVEGYLSDGRTFHVDYHYSEHRDYEPNYTVLAPPQDGDQIVCRLDCDDIESYGPEHITLKTTTKLPYYFYVHQFSSGGTLSASGAKVTIHQGNALIAEFNVPIGDSSDEYWNVFAIKNGEVIAMNTITDSPDTSYAD